MFIASARKSRTESGPGCQLNTDDYIGAHVGVLSPFFSFFFFRSLFFFFFSFLYASQLKGEERTYTNKENENDISHRKDFTLSKHIILSFRDDDSPPPPPQHIHTGTPKSYRKLSCKSQRQYQRVARSQEASPTDVRSHKSVAAPTCLKGLPECVSHFNYSPIHSLAYNQLGPFGEREFTERK